MALTRKLLSALGLEQEKVDEIITAHTETVDALKEQIARYKEDAEKLQTVQTELDKLKADAAKNDGKNPFEVKYNALKEEFDQYKTDIQAKETKTAKESAYRELLKSAGIPDKRLEAVLRVSDIDSVELDGNGTIKEADKLTDSIKTEWADFIPTQGQVGANPANPPANPAIDYEHMSDADYYKATYEAAKKG